MSFFFLRFCLKPDPELKKLRPGTDFTFERTPATIAAGNHEQACQVCRVEHFELESLSVAASWFGVRRRTTSREGILSPFATLQSGRPEPMRASWPMDTCLGVTLSTVKILVAAGSDAWLQLTLGCIRPRRWQAVSWSPASDGLYIFGGCIDGELFTPNDFFFLSSPGQCLAAGETASNTVSPGARRLTAYTSLAAGALAAGIR